MSLVNGESKCDMKPAVELNKTFEFKIENYLFGDLPEEICREIWKDGRPFSHFIEQYISSKFPVDHVPGCKKYDFTDRNHPEIKYDEKTFTNRGCKYCPSNMLGQGRTFNQAVFEEKTKKLIFCIVSNINFPNIKVRFVEGETLLKNYPKGVIPLKEHDKFFN